MEPRDANLDERLILLLKLPEYNVEASSTSGLQVSQIQAFESVKKGAIEWARACDKW